MRTVTPLTHRGSGPRDLVARLEWALSVALVSAAVGALHLQARLRARAR
jgi:hypothetical protein